MADKKYARADLEALAHRIAVQKGVDPALVKAVIDQETGGTWNPRSLSQVRNKKTGNMEPGAGGLMQLMPDTARAMGVGAGDDPAGLNRYDPVTNLTAGIEYLNQQIKRFGDVGLALAAYNWGPGNAAKLEANPAGMRPPKETLDYVPGVFKRMGKYGETLAPSAITAALFPGVSGAISSTISDQVARRTGAATPASIEQTLRAGKSAPPGPPQGAVLIAAGDASMSAPTSAQQMMSGGAGPMLTPPPIEVPAVGTLPAAATAPSPAGMAPTQALLTPPIGRAGTESLAGYLRSQFGPMADIADPFTKAYDAELSRLIDRA